MPAKPNNANPRTRGIGPSTPRIRGFAAQRRGADALVAASSALSHLLTAAETS